MRPRLRVFVRENALCALFAGAGTAAMVWLGLYGFGWNDYETEAKPAFEALTHGHVLEFLRLAPAYGGSLVERAPFALLPGLWGGGELAVYRMVALPCLLAVAALGVWLVAQLRRPGAGGIGIPASRFARGVALGLCVANPLTLRALELGHPEELLGGALCVAAVLFAARERPVWAGLALGLAIANKEWALLAIGPVLLALPSRRALCMACAAAVAAFVLAPLALVGSSGFVASTRGAAAPPSSIFQPWQAFWFLGRHGPVVHGLFGVAKPGYRTAPGWVGTISHPLIVAVSLPLTALAWGRGRRGQSDALLLLALLLLLRCVLDTWDTVYYMIPFVLALLAWESLGERRRPALLALSCTVLGWVSFVWLPEHVSADAQSACFLAWTMPLILVARPAPIRAGADTQAHPQRASSPPAPPSGDDRQLLGEQRQHLLTARGHDDEVLDPHAQPAGQVDAGLDRHDVTDQQRILARQAREARPLVNLEPDAVAETVAEVIALPRLLDHLACDRIDLFAVRTGLDRGERPFLGFQHERVDLPGSRGDPLAGRVRARAVRAVALVQRAPVDRQQRVLADLPRARLGVRQRAVRAGGDDRGEACARGAEAAHAQLQLDRHVALAAADDAGFERFPQRLVGQPAGGADAVDLTGVLDRAQSLDETRAGDELPLLAEQLGSGARAA